MKRQYTIKINIDGLWQYYRSFDIELNAIKKFDEIKDLFDCVLFDGDNIVRKSKSTI